MTAFDDLGVFFELRTSTLDSLLSLPCLDEQLRNLASGHLRCLTSQTSNPMLRIIPSHDLPVDEAFDFSRVQIVGMVRASTLKRAIPETGRLRVHGQAASAISLG